MWKGLFLTGSLLAAIIYLMSPKVHCVCGVRIPDGGGMCECGEYNGRKVIKIDRQKVFEQELKRIEEERSKGNSYDTFL